MCEGLSSIVPHCLTHMQAAGGLTDTQGHTTSWMTVIHSNTTMHRPLSGLQTSNTIKTWFCTGAQPLIPLFSIGFCADMFLQNSLGYDYLQFI